MNEATRCVRRYRVSGRVQGVYFRASTREQARSLGLDGWVRNLDDGQVEALAAGTPAALAAFEAWLARGPAQAVVSGVSAEASGEQPAAGFVVR